MAPKKRKVSGSGPHFETFTDRPDLVVIPVVREFYANAFYERKDDQVFVRGKMVSFVPKVINAYYKLPYIADDEYAKYKQEELDYNEIIQEMCVPGTKWKSSQDKNHAVLSYPENTLNQFAKAWHKFICSNFMPTSHEHEVTAAHSILLYCICTKRTINVGKVIRDSLLHSIQAKTTGGHTHPCLITGLCQTAGVKINANEPTQDPGPIINSSLISRYTVWAGGTSKCSRLGFIVDPDLPVPPSPKLMSRIRKIKPFGGLEPRYFPALRERRERALNLGPPRQAPLTQSKITLGGPSSSTQCKLDERSFAKLKKRMLE
ncbi:hypothetical protein OWV82_006704 [Melia azedarach]|uniref:Uncharacterized protein n=1 Tax=Melia azedarach TaxID=155640 RepID=A0ACC1YI18_MELAZ|nr:hypothetical protein OWV82_006704 [Melia azedarach]